MEAIKWSRSVIAIRDSRLEISSSSLGEVIGSFMFTVVFADDVVVTIVLPLLSNTLAEREREREPSSRVSLSFLHMLNIEILPRRRLEKQTTAKQNSRDKGEN